MANLVRHQKTALAGGYVSGVRPLRGLYDVGSGVADLFLLPVQQVGLVLFFGGKCMLCAHACECEL